MKPGCSGTVEPNSSMIAGPVDDRARGEVGAPQHRRLDVPVGGVEADRAARPVSAGGAAPSAERVRGWISGRWIGPMPETRRLTHSTCWVASPAKS